MKDFLKKIPGINVLSSGKIKYNGEYIRNFYIEGIDLLGSDYELATIILSFFQTGALVKK